MAADGGREARLPAMIITGNYGYKPLNIVGKPAGIVVDLTGWSGSVNNSKNAKPTATKDCSVGTLPTNFYGLTAERCPNVTLSGGRIDGTVPMGSEWKATYCGSACGYRLKDSPGGKIVGARVDRSWDAFRIIYSPGWTIEDCHVPICRDDFLEDDVQEGGTIRNVLVQGCLNGISCVPSSNPRKVTSPQTITMEKVLLRLKKFNQGGKQTHGTPFKWDTTNKAYNPALVLRDCVIAIEHPGHAGKARLREAFSKVKQATNCVYLNLSDTKLPSTYPKLPAGFTLLQGANARYYWNRVESAWLASNA